MRFSFFLLFLLSKDAAEEEVDEKKQKKRIEQNIITPRKKVLGKNEVQPKKNNYSSIEAVMVFCPYGRFSIAFIASPILLVCKLT